MAYFKVHNHLLSHTCKPSIKFLLSLSLFSILFGYIPSVLQSLEPFLIHFFSYIVEKSYMFLLCNGLLVLIALNSLLINTSSSPTSHQIIEPVVPIEKINRFESKEPEIAVAAPIVVQETESHQEQENVISDTHEDEDEDEQEEEDEDEDEDDKHSVDETEELNKKCEDFIRRMKATFSSNNLEARVANAFYFDNQNSLVTVN